VLRNHHTQARQSPDAGLVQHIERADSPPAGGPEEGANFIAIP